VTIVIRDSIAFAVLAVSAGSAVLATPSVRIVHSFNGQDGSSPSAEAAPVRGPFGTVFGATARGGPTDEGVVYYLDRWDRFHIAHTFTQGEGQPWMPSSVFVSPGGRIYGTTRFGGEQEAGPVFRLDPGGVVTTVHAFNYLDGNQASGSVALQDGYFYGATGFGGNYEGGTIYRMSVDTEEVSVVYENPAMFSNDAGMYYGVARGPAGEVYCATYGYDVGDYHGVVFKIDVSGTRTVLHTFEGGADGNRATAPPVVTADGTVFGTTYMGGTNDLGVVYKITPGGEYSVLHSFGNDSASPFSGVVLGSNGKLYGTTMGGGDAGYGAIYEISQTGEFRVVYSFTGVNNFGGPQGGLLEKAPGVFYGTTGGGGRFGKGTIYKLRLD
jgi:uncharacterized repeat protein (TIGR03803 family)